MNVLIVPSWYKTEHNPTLGSFFQEQAVALKNEGVNVVIADVTYQGKRDYFSRRNFHVRKFDDDGIRLFAVSGG